MDRFNVMSRFPYRPDERILTLRSRQETMARWLSGRMQDRVCAQFEAWTVIHCQSKNGTGKSNLSACQVTKELRIEILQRSFSNHH
jgi:hypothetical protein